MKKKSVEDCKAFWEKIQTETRLAMDHDPVLEKLAELVLPFPNAIESLAMVLASKLANAAFSVDTLNTCFLDTLADIPEIECILSRDVEAVYLRDCACVMFIQPWLFYKGFHAIQAARIMHRLLQKNNIAMAYWLQNRVSQVFGVDIHPAAKIGRGVMFDHATGIVIGETAEIGDDVSIMQNVTLGGTGKDSGDRHPKIRRGALVSVGAKILGNIEVGEGAMVSAGSVVLKPVAPHTSVAGIPAKPVGTPSREKPAFYMDHSIQGGTD